MHENIPIKYDFSNENLVDNGCCTSNNVAEILESLEQKLENQYLALDRLEEENKKRKELEAKHDLIFSNLITDLKCENEGIKVNLKLENKSEEKQEEQTLKEENIELEQEFHEKCVEMELEDEIEKEIKLFEKLISDLDQKDKEVNANLRSRNTIQQIKEKEKNEEDDEEIELYIENFIEPKTYEEENFIEYQNKNDNEFLQVENSRLTNLEQSILVREVNRNQEKNEIDASKHQMIRKIEHVEIFWDDDKDELGSEDLTSINILEKENKAFEFEFILSFEDNMHGHFTKRKIFMPLLEFLFLPLIPPRIMRRVFMGMMKDNFWSYPWREKLVSLHFFLLINKSLV
jgi:hypothetical protein